MQTEKQKTAILKAENKRLIAANEKLLKEIDHWKMQYQAAIQKKKSGGYNNGRD